MNHDELVLQVEKSLRRIAGKDLEGPQQEEMNEMVGAFVRDEVRDLTRDEILSRFDSPVRSLEAFWEYLDRLNEADIDECCRCMQEEPSCAI